LLTGNPLAAIGLVTSLIPVEKTFGAVFANGFNLSCWGSTAPPSVTKAWGEKDFPLVLNGTLAKGITLENLNTYLDAMNFLETRARDWAGKMKSCSRDGLNNYADAAKTAKEGMIEGVRTALAQQNIQMIATTPVNKNTYPPFKFTDDGFNKWMTPYTSERFNIIMPQQQEQQSQQSQSTATNSGGTAEKSQTGIVPLLVGGAILAAKFLI
jgi:hypothetical protein